MTRGRRQQRKSEEGSVVTSRWRQGWQNACGSASRGSGAGGAAGLRARARLGRRVGVVDERVHEPLRVLEARPRLDQLRKRRVRKQIRMRGHMRTGRDCC
eukprot:5234316-Pleurochrysis_carterae.AAC.15